MILRAVILISALLAGCLGEKPENTAEYAVETQNMSACLGISDPRMRNSCIADVAIESESIEMCKSIVEADWRNQCITRIAGLRNDIRICDEIPTHRASQECMRSLGAKSE